jgi:hypothetical protein
MTLDGARLQEHFDRAQQSWLLRDDEDWRAFVNRRSAPRPPWWTPMDRAAWKTAHDAAIAYGRREEARTLTLLPLWIGNNDDEVDGGEWELRRVLVDDEGDVVVELEDAPPLAFFARVRGRRVTIQLVSRGRFYAPGVPGVTFHGPFAVAEAMGRFIVDDVSDVRPLASAPAPAGAAASVPAFSAITRAGCSLDDVDAATRALIERAIVKGSFTPD